MKNILLLLLMFSAGNTCISQGVFSNQTNNILEKVVQDYPSQFKNIKGEVVSSKSGSTEYKSTISIPGAVSTTITQSVAAHKQTVSWQSVFIPAKNFLRLKPGSKNLFNQIKNTIIKPQGGKAAIVNGLYMDPSEDKTFTTIQFDLLPATGFCKRYNIDLMLRTTKTMENYLKCI